MMTSGPMRNITKRVALPSARASPSTYNSPSERSYEARSSATPDGFHPSIIARSAALKRKTPLGCRALLVHPAAAHKSDPRKPPAALIPATRTTLCRQTKLWLRVSLLPKLVASDIPGSGQIVAVNHWLNSLVRCCGDARCGWICPKFASCATQATSLDWGGRKRSNADWVPQRRCPHAGGNRAWTWRRA